MQKKIKKLIIKNLKLVVLFICLIAVVAIIENIFNKELMLSDILSYKLIVKVFRCDLLTAIMKFITNIGGIVMITTVTIFSFIVTKNKRIALCILINVIIITTLNIILKNIIQRPRPEGFRLVSESGYSFPSGHSMVSAAFYGLITYFFYINIKNKKIRNLICIFMSIFILLIGVSRIYLGVHYASDVIAGFLIAIAYLIIFISIIKKTIYDTLDVDKQI